MAGLVVGFVVGFVVGEVGGGRLGSQTILPPQELHNTRRPV